MATSETTRRRAQLAAVLIVKGMTQEQLATHLKVDPSHLHRVLFGKRESARLTQAIDAYIAKYAPKAVA